MNTYDYYKNQQTHILRGQSKIFVENGHVMIEVYDDDPYGFPNQVKKGIWSVNKIVGATQYVPEGDPEYDENGEQIVWGEIIAPKAVCENPKLNDGLYPRKLIEQSKKYWNNK